MIVLIVFVTVFRCRVVVTAVVVAAKVVNRSVLSWTVITLDTEWL